MYVVLMSTDESRICQSYKVFSTREEAQDYTWYFLKKYGIKLKMFKAMEDDILIRYTFIAKIKGKKICISEMNIDSYNKKDVDGIVLEGVFRGMSRFDKNGNEIFSVFVSGANVKDFYGAIKRMISIVYSYNNFSEYEINFNVNRVCKFEFGIIPNVVKLVKQMPIDIKILYD